MRRFAACERLRLLAPEAPGGPSGAEEGEAACRGRRAGGSVSPTSRNTLQTWGGPPLPIRNFSRVGVRGIIPREVILQLAVDPEDNSSSPRASSNYFNGLVGLLDEEDRAADGVVAAEEGSLRHHKLRGDASDLEADTDALRGAIF